VNKRLVARGILIAGLALASVWAILPKINAAHFFSITPADSVEILVANRYVPGFTAVTPTAARLVLMPKAFLPPGALFAKTDLLTEEGRPRYSAAVAIPEGQPLTQALLTPVTQDDSLALLVRAGRAAVSFEVDKAHGVGGWIKPGDVVALYRTSSEIDQAKKRTRLLLASVPIVAVDNVRLGRPPEPEKPAEDNLMPSNAPEQRVLTVLVSANEAAAIIEAREHGAISVVLRAPGDELPWPDTP
jgi:Flp pilus assembly protein CpaB